MNWLLDHWQPKHKATKVICYVLKLIRLFVALAFFVVPLLWNLQETFDVFKWLWIGLAVMMMDSFIIPNKKTQEQKLVFPQFTIFTILLAIYLLCYWHILSLAIIICGNIIIGVLETVTQISKYKTFKFHAEQKTKTFPKHIIHSFWVSAFYIIAVTLFVCGILESRTMTFIFGGIADLMLVVSIVLTIGKGGLEKKDTFGIILFLIDVLSAVALMTYLIYLIAPEGNNSLQTTILTMVAAIIGGLLTLSGVAWTIRKTEKDRKEEEIKKSKPVFVINKLFDEPKISEKERCCFDKIDNYQNYQIGVFAEIENSDASVFTVNKVYHDNQWWAMEGDTTILPNKKVIISFRFNKDVNNLFLQVQDALGNSYYYELKVLLMFSITGKKPSENNDFAHTIREINEITLEEITQRLESQKKDTDKEGSDNA